MRKEISFKTTREEAGIIDAIAIRAERELGADTLLTAMDITATHANGNPLRLQELLKADTFNFAHDIHGIAEHLDRSTGELTRHFSPRFSA